ncbi:MAG: hypothetical protein BroJett018_10800 [Chloroflexota bacterium]|nr:hypothetical protein [Chloroflexota bacterium]GIK63286.1 MAG: hypothetical protein BroJett018_10800 [Chloroflexota bacterium]
MQNITINFTAATTVNAALKLNEKIYHHFCSDPFICSAARLLIQHMGYIPETHYLRVYFAQLGQKIEENPTLPEMTITESGIAIG